MELIKRFVAAVLTMEARAVLRRYKPKVVAVTGNVGKTSTRDAIFAVMAKRFHVRKSEKNFNNEFGIPLTILGRPSALSNPFGWLMNIVYGAKLALVGSRYPEWLVLEVGADHPGDIRKVTEWLKPDISVITKIPDVPVHVEHFESPAQVAEEKSYLVRALKRDGTLVLNADDGNAMSFREFAPDNALVSYGFEPATVRASGYEISYDREEGKVSPRGIKFAVSADGADAPVYIYGSLGRTHVYPALAAIAVGKSLGLGLLEMAEALGKHRGPLARMRILEGERGTTLIDDTYNSSPAASEQALSALKSLECAGRKIAVMGDMLELGRFSIDAHKKVGELAAGSCDIFVAVGIRSRYAAEAALNAGMDESKVLQFDESKEAGEYVEQLLSPGDIVLIKGSQGMRMERAVLEMMADPGQAENLLARQGREWANK